MQKTKHRAERLSQSKNNRSNRKREKQYWHYIRSKIIAICLTLPQLYRCVASNKFRVSFPYISYIYRTFLHNLVHTLPLVVRLEPPSPSLLTAHIYIDLDCEFCARLPMMCKNRQNFFPYYKFFIRSTRMESWKLGRALFLMCTYTWCGLLMGGVGKTLKSTLSSSLSHFDSLWQVEKMWIIVWVSICDHPWELLVVISSPIFPHSNVCPRCIRALAPSSSDRPTDESDLHRIAQTTVNVHALSYTLSLSFTVDNTPNSRKRRKVRKTMCVM